MKNDVDGKVVAIDGGVMMKNHVAPPNQGDARLDPLSKVKSTFRQPLGGWRFMSANQLRNPQGDTLVEDEIESFFHLLLFCALRYLPHNCRDVPAFMEEYFDGHTRYNGEDFGGYAKWIAMNSGHTHLFNGVAGPLTFYLPSELNNKPGSSFHDPSMTSTPSNRDALSSTPRATAPCDTFHSRMPHPINTLFSGLLQSFHAHYTLIKEKNKPSARLVAAPVPVPVVEEADEAPTEEEMWFIDAYNVDFEEPVRKKGTVYSECTVLERLAANIKRHEDVLGFFRRVLGSASNRMPDSTLGPWPRNDKGLDQLRFRVLEDFCPDEARGPVESGGEFARG